MSSPRGRAGFNIPRPYTFMDEGITFNFGFYSSLEDEISVCVVLTKREFVKDGKHYRPTSDFMVLSNKLIKEASDFDNHHRWLTEGFRQHLLKFIKLKAFL